MAAYLILGAGKFGRLALRRLARQDAAAIFWVVERDSQALEEAQQEGCSGVTWVAADAVAFLVERLREPVPWDWLIPMAPGHLAFGWLWQAHLAAGGWEMNPAPAALEKIVPLARRGPQGELYLSRADFLCPDDCPEPDTVCPVSGESREIPLYAELAAGCPPDFRLAVIASRQLASGVGGYPPDRLTGLARELADVPGKWLIATACRCHGVVHAVKKAVSC